MTALFHEAPAGTSASSRLFGRLRDQLAASDPAFSRLRLASRALLSLILSAAVLAGLTFLHALPVAAYGLAVVISFTGSMAIRDRTSHDQLITRLYATGASIAAAFTAGLLGSNLLVADIAFLAVIFVAVYVRKFGQRWFAVGMIAFMSYFIGDYLRPVPADIGWLSLAAAIAFGATHLVTNVILRDDPERDFRRALVTIDRRINLIARNLLQSNREGIASAEERKPLQSHLSRLRDIVLIAEGFIPQGEAGSLAKAGPASELAIALFEIQLVVERMVRASYLALPPHDLLRAVLHHDDDAAQSLLRASHGATADQVVTAHLLARVSRARIRLIAALGRSPSPAFAIVDAEAPASGPGNAKPLANPSAKSPAGSPASIVSTAPRVPVSLHLPIQVTLASAIAMGCGLLLSPARWYWAVIAAFIVFNNTKSRADTAVRALQRSGGTFAGLIAGTAVATLLHGQMVVSGAAIPILFFLAFYFLQTSYSVMIFFITVALALLYGVMGTFTPELLLLRLAETVVGSLSGTLVAFLVFPARASTGAAAALSTYLSALRDLIVAAKGRAHGAPEPLHLRARSRLLDRSYAELANAVRPLGGPWHAVTRFGEVRQRLLLLTGCAHWGRVLARSLKQGDTLPPAIVERIDTLADEVLVQIAKAESSKDVFFERPRRGDGTEKAPRAPLPITTEEDPAFALEVISALLDRAISGSG